MLQSKSARGFYEFSDFYGFKSARVLCVQLRPFYELHSFDNNNNFNSPLTSFTHRVQ